MTRSGTLFAALLLLGCFDPAMGGSTGTAPASSSGTNADPSASEGREDASSAGPGPSDATTSSATSASDPELTSGASTSTTASDVSSGAVVDGTNGDTMPVTSAGSEGACVPQCGALACGPDPACGESCGDCEPNETCLDDGAFCGAEYGYGDDFGFSNLANPDVVFGHRFTLPVAATLERFGVLAGAAGNVRMALYTHDGSGPATLVAQSGEFAVLAGSNEHAVAEVDLVPGDYWIAIVLEASTSLRSTDLDDDAHEMFYALMAYDSAFSANSTGDVLINSVLFNLYVVVDDG